MKTSYKLIITIGYKELHFNFPYIQLMDEFIRMFYSTLIVGEEDGKEVRMSVIIVPSSVAESEDEE